MQGNARTRSGGVVKTFSPLALTQRGLLGVRLHGSPGRAVKKHLGELTRRCLESGKLRVVLDLSELESLGGGGAAALAELQRELSARGGGVVFVGATDVLQRFLARPFRDLPLPIFSDVQTAEAALSSGSPIAAPVGASREASAEAPAESAAARKATDRVPEGEDAEPVEAILPPMTGDEKEGGGAVALTAEWDAENDSSLDLLLDEFSATDPEPAAPGPETTAPSREGAVPGREPAVEQRKARKDGGRAGPPAADPPGAESVGAARPQFISLDEALSAISQARDADGLAEPLTVLLQGHDLASDLVYLTRRNGRLVSTDGQLSFATDGALARQLAAVERPLSLLDIQEDELDEEEARLLADARPDLILPIRRSSELIAAAFLQRGRRQAEYDVREHFALELVMRLLAEHANGKVGRGRASGRAEPDLLQVRQSEVLLDLSRKFSTVATEEALWERLQRALVVELGLDALIYWQAGDGEDQAVRVGRLMAEVQLPNQAARRVRVFCEGLENPVRVRDLPEAAEFRREDLLAAGMEWLGALRWDRELMGFLLLGRPGLADNSAGAARGSRSKGAEGHDVAAAFLAGILQQVAIALRAIRSNRRRQRWSLDLIRILVAQLEERHYGTTLLTERLARLVEATAEDLELPEGMRHDLVLGTLLRDIGMIPLGDLMLHSPRKLSAEQWHRFREHAQAGVRVLEGLTLPATVREIILHHHERFNGEGYPDRLKGEEIPLPARLVAVAEYYVAMITDIPHRKRLAREEARAILHENWGQRYDPDLVEVLLRTLDRVEDLLPTATVTQ